MKKRTKNKAPAKRSLTGSVREPSSSNSRHPLGSPFGTFLGDIARRELDSIEIPDDLEPVSGSFAKRRLERLDDDLQDPAAYFTSRDGGCDSYAEFMRDKYGSSAQELSEATREIVQDAIQSTFRAGFYIAVMRYSDQLRHVPEAVAVVNQRLTAAHKGGAGRRKKAEPLHKAIRKRFREMRKTTPKKTLRYLRVAEEFGMSDRHIARIVEGID